MFQLLVVDDDKNIRRFLCAVLSNAGYRPFGAACAARRFIRRVVQWCRHNVWDAMNPVMVGEIVRKRRRLCRS